MKIVIKFLKKNWPMVLIVLISLIVWYKLLGQTLFGEGYYYFDIGQRFIVNSKLTDIRTTDVFAKLITSILLPIFKDNMTYYLAFQLIVMILLSLSFFYTLYTVTKEKWLSFTATIFFSVSYIGIFEMLGSGNYQRFLQRIPNLVLLFIAFIFFFKHLEKNKFKHFLTKELVISYLIFALAVFLAHFSTFLLPLFAIYPVLLALTQKKKVKPLLQSLFYASIYFVINFGIISQDPLEPKNSLWLFITGRKDILEKIILQFASLNIPPFLIDGISKIAQPFQNTLIIVTVPVIIVYIVGFFSVKSRFPKLRVLYVTSVLVIPILLFLNLYLGKVDPVFDITGFHYYFLPNYYFGKIDTFTAIKGDRYYLVPMFFVSFIWSSIILSIFKNKLKIYKLFTVILLTLYTIYNITLIWDKLDHLQPLANEVKSYITYIKSIKSEFKPNTTLVVPEYFLWPSTLIRVLYGYPDMQFLSTARNWRKDINPKYKDEVIVIDYNYKTKIFKELTQNYKKGEKITFTSY